MHLLIDSASLYYRSYYALPESMTAPDGRPNNAIRGFLSTMARLVAAYSAEDLVCAWDADWRPQWRVDLLPSYKAHRVAGDAEGGTETEETPETLSPQVEGLAEILDAMGVARPSAIGYEADDVLATLAAQCTAPAIVVSGDRDLVQIVRDPVRVLLTVNGGMEKWPLLNEADVTERFGVSADAYVDFAVLRGDPSDGLPGVPGIGVKTAAALINTWGGIDEILAAAASAAPGLSPKRAAALLESAEYLHAARIVATAVRNVELPVSRSARDDCRLHELGDAWGVARQVADLRTALTSHQR